MEPRLPFENLLNATADRIDNLVVSSRLTADKRRELYRNLGLGAFGYYAGATSLMFQLMGSSTTLNRNLVFLFASQALLGLGGQNIVALMRKIKNIERGEE